MPSYMTTIGLHLRDGYAQQLYLDSSVTQRNDYLDIGLVTLNSSGWFLHKTDAGRRGSTWYTEGMNIVLNRGGAQGTITIQYVFTDLNFDLSSPTDRAALEQLLSVEKTYAEFSNDPAQIGRYRYLKFNLLSESGAEDPTVTESAESQILTMTAEYAEALNLSVATTEVSRTVSVWRKTTPTIALTYMTSFDGTGRYNIDGAEVLVWIGKSIKQVEADAAALFGPLTATVDNGALGEASITLTQAQTTLSPGDYIMQVQLTKGGTILRHTVELKVLGTYL